MTCEAKEKVIQEALVEWRRLVQVSQEFWEVARVKEQASIEAEKEAKKADFETASAHTRLKHLVIGIEE